MNDEAENKHEATSGDKPHVFIYKDAGIYEKHGYIPLWLLAVAVVLLIWGVYYLVVYWSPPPT